MALVWFFFILPVVVLSDTTLSPVVESTEHSAMPEVFAKEAPVLETCEVGERYDELSKCYLCEFENCARTCELHNCTDIIERQFHEIWNGCFKDPNWKLCNTEVTDGLMNALFTKDAKVITESHPKSECLYSCSKLRTYRCSTKCNDKTLPTPQMKEEFKTCKETIGKYSATMFPELQHCIKDRYLVGIDVLQKGLQVACKIFC